MVVLASVVTVLLAGSSPAVADTPDPALSIDPAAALAALHCSPAFTRPKAPGQSFDAHWVSTIGVDLVAFSALQFLQAGGINYAPLFALPVLMAAVLGTTLLALGTAAGVALLLLADAWVWGDTVLLTEALNNLIDNALRYTPRGGSATVRCGVRSSDACLSNFGLRNSTSLPRRKPTSFQSSMAKSNTTRPEVGRLSASA